MFFAIFQYNTEDTVASSKKVRLIKVYHLLEPTSLDYKNDGIYMFDFQNYGIPPVKPIFKAHYTPQ